MNYLNNLNNQQRQAVECIDGPLMVVAGAGSGKTKVLTNRLAYMIHHKGVNPNNIMALTFTKKAAEEMKARIVSLIKDDSIRNSWIGTFHHVFVRILREDGYKIGYNYGFSIYDKSDSVSLINRIVKDKGLDKEVYNPPLISKIISLYKSNLITLKQYLNENKLIENNSRIGLNDFDKIYKSYTDRCLEFGAMDFDDILVNTNKLLNKFPDVLKKYQNRFKYIMVDEYQDTNHAQYQTLKLLASLFRNIFVVGDDSQSIYSFRGAKIRNILNFQRDYSDAKIIKLEQNYRSSNSIVLAANSVIEKNTNKIPKNLWTNNNQGEKITVIQLYDGHQESRFISKLISDNLNKGKNIKDMAILYRNNSQSMDMEKALLDIKIPYKIIGARSFLERAHIKNILAYLRLIINKNDEQAIFKIINYPRRGIGDGTLNKISQFAKDSGKTFFDCLVEIDNIKGVGLSAKQKIKDFHKIVLDISKLLDELDAFDIINKVLHNFGIIKYLMEEQDIKFNSVYDDAQQLMNQAKYFVVNNSNKGLEFNLVAFMEEITLATDIIKENEDIERDDKLTLMTIHMAKGLEFKYVYIIGMEDGIFPSNNSISDLAKLEEERRLFYVALTRAMEKIYISFVKSRYRFGREHVSKPSRFMSDLDKKFIDYKNYDNSFIPEYKHNKSNSLVVKTKPKLSEYNKISNRVASFSYKGIKEGSIVYHSKFGKGQVIKIEPSNKYKKATIKFDDKTRDILLGFAKLDLLS